MLSRAAKALFDDHKKRLYSDQTKPICKTAELEKISAVSEKSNIIGQFLDWLYEQGYILAKYRKHDYLEDSSIRTEKLLASYFKIDLNKAESERISLLNDLRTERERSKK